MHDFGQFNFLLSCTDQESRFQLAPAMVLDPDGRQAFEQVVGLCPDLLILRKVDPGSILWTAGDWKLEPDARHVG